MYNFSISRHFVQNQQEFYAYFFCGFSAKIPQILEIAQELWYNSIVC